MGNGYQCPYCGLVTSVTENNRRDHLLLYDDKDSWNGRLNVTMQKCVACGAISFTLLGREACWGNTIYYAYPPAGIKIFPDYVPIAIRNDYAEAYSILQLSPKAAATLARRCLQGMIHDFWNIHEKNLNAEITALRDKVSSIQWQAIDALRKIGNIGAHMEQDVDRIVDVEPDEAQKLLSLIELLVDKWYVSRHDEEQMLLEIKTLADQKEQERKKSD